MTSSVYLNNRHHDPTLGAFVSVDPLVVRTGEAYIYANGNPSTFSDPTGLEVCYDDPSHSKYGQCYEAADGEYWSQTHEEEALTVAHLEVDPETVIEMWRQINSASWDPNDPVQQEQRWTSFYSALYGGELDPVGLLIDSVGDLSTASGYLATGCGLFAWTGVGAKCAAVAGGASLGLGAAETGLLTLTGDPDAKCSAVGVALDVIVPNAPVPTAGDASGAIAANTVKAAAGHAVDLTC